MKAMSLTPLPLTPQESVPLAYIFCLTGHEWSLARKPGCQGLLEPALCYLINF